MNNTLLIIISYIIAFLLGSLYGLYQAKKSIMNLLKNKNLITKLLNNNKQ